jgi:uncharacterized membrane protein
MSELTSWRRSFSAPSSTGPAITSWVTARPLIVFLLFSILAGPFLIFLTPPLRGPDELPHFIRAYGLSMGEIVPRTTDEHGRKGIFISARLDHQIKLYNEAMQSLFEHKSTTFPQALERYRQLQAVTPDPANHLVFAPYAGSEGYAPVPYLPYLPALFLARWFDLDFLTTIYLMRIFGFLVVTIAMAVAIALLPELAWSFALIAFLPSALFSRAVLSADGSALALTMLVTAATLQSARGDRPVGIYIRSLALALCALTKPTQLIFIFLEAITAPARLLVRYWRTTAIVIVPAVIASLTWVAASSADVAAWRILDGTNNPPEYYQPIWRIQYMVEHPLHFPTLLMNTYEYLDDYWLQLIGILGWLDMPLRTWLYPLLTGLLLAVFCRPFKLQAEVRDRVVAVGVLIIIGYILGMFLIWYLVWTGLDETKIEGVQGRYFVVLLPIVAIIIAASVRRGIIALQPTMALLGMFLSCWASLDAITRADWKFALSFP